MSSISWSRTSAAMATAGSVRRGRSTSFPVPRRLEDMTAEALEEYYAHSAGHKPTYEIARVYERYADLTTLEQARALAARARPTELHRFAAEAYVGDGIKHLSEDSANTEATLTVAFDGAEVPYREVRPRLLNEPDRRPPPRPLRSAAARSPRSDLNPMLRELAERERELAADLGAATVLDALRATSASTRRRRPRRPRRSWPRPTRSTARSIDAPLRPPLGVALERRGRSDLARLWRAPEFDAGVHPEPRAPGAARDAGRPRHRPRRPAQRRAGRRGPARARCRAPSARRSVSPAGSCW